jgi:hypothetical protein
VHLQMKIDYIGISIGSGLCVFWLVWFIVSIRYFGAFVGQPPKWFSYANTFVSAMLLLGVMFIPILLLQHFGENSRENVARFSLVTLSILVTCYATSLITVYWRS